MVRPILAAVVSHWRTRSVITSSPDEYSLDLTLAEVGTDTERRINAFAVYLLLPRNSVVQRWRSFARRRSPEGMPRQYFAPTVRDDLVQVVPWICSGGRSPRTTSHSLTCCQSTHCNASSTPFREAPCL